MKNTLIVVAFIVGLPFALLVLGIAAATAGNLLAEFGVPHILGSALFLVAFIGGMVGIEYVRSK